MNADISSIQEFIRSLLSAIANAGLYSAGHQQVTRLTGAAFDSITSVLSSSAEVTLVIIDKELLINGEPQEWSMFINRFAEILANRGIGHLKLMQGLTLGEIEGLITSLARKSGEAGFSPTPHIRVGRIEVRTGGSGEARHESTVGDTPSPGQESKRVKIPDMPREELSRFMEIYDAVRKRRKLRINGMYEIVSGFVDAFRSEGNSMLAMAALRNTDEYTFTHSTNVCILNIAQAMTLGIEGQLLHDIGIAAMLHDIGKLFIPEEILTKKDKLTPEEFNIMKKHPVLGAKHLIDTPGVPRLAVTAAYEHHIKYDRTGYPAVPADWHPNLCSQMTMISDFFDALRTRRSYREPVDFAVIAGMMHEMSGKEFHPALMENFLQLINRLSETCASPLSPVSPS